jgi:hypothetical protein
MLVAGFDFAGDGFIFTIEHPGDVMSFDAVGWSSIGSGSDKATDMLLRRSVNYEMDLPHVLYHVCEAKFMAESADGVGRHTVVKVAMGSGSMDHYEASDGLIENIRTACAGRSISPVSDWVIERLRNDLNKHPSLGQGN